jgi:sugar phosphate isomerase/epimerase
MTSLSLAHLTIAEATPSELALAAAEAGFKAVGLRITGFAPDGPGPDLVGNRARIRALRGILGDGGLGVTSICTYRLTDERAASDYAAVFETCREIGADTVLVTCFIQDRRQARDRIAELAALAAPFGIDLGLEFLKTSALRSLGDAETIRCEIGSTNLGHIIDALHLQRCGHTPSELRALPTDSLYGVQICDAQLSTPTGDRVLAEIRDRLYPGEGELPLFALLDNAGPKAWVEIEAPKAQHAGRTIAERAAFAFSSASALMTVYAGRERRQAN